MEPLKAKPRTPADVKDNIAGTLELKYNPWHDTQDGKFTSEGQGQKFGDGGGVQSGRGSANVSWSKPTPWPALKPKGGSFGGGGASGSWDRLKPKTTVLKVQQPKREIVKPPVFVPRAPAPKKAAKQPIRKISAGGYNFEADTQDRTVRAHGQLRLEASQRRSRSAQLKAGQPDRLPKDHGGHFIGRQFGGPETRYNHFAQNARFNNSDYRMLENDWKRELKAGRKVRVDIKATYPRNSKRPNRINATYYINGKRRFKSLPNYK